MNPRQRSPSKNLFIKLLIFCASLLLGYALFLGVLSVRVGLTHPSQDGSWLPIFAGVLLIGLALWFYFRLVGSLVRAMKRSDILTR
jgi:cytochrome c biogenesis protein CcdA